MKVNRKPYYHRSSIENTLAQMPRYNAYACGYGKHKSKKKPNRAKRKEELRKELKIINLKKQNTDNRRV